MNSVHIEVMFYFSFKCPGTQGMHLSPDHKHSEMSVCSRLLMTSNSEDHVSQISDSSPKKLLFLWSVSFSGEYCWVL